MLSGLKISLIVHLYTYLPSVMSIVRSTGLMVLSDNKVAISLPFVLAHTMLGLLEGESQNNLLKIYIIKT